MTNHEDRGEHFEQSSPESDRENNALLSGAGCWCVMAGVIAGGFIAAMLLAAKWLSN